MKKTTRRKAGRAAKKAAPRKATRRKAPTRKATARKRAPRKAAARKKAAPRKAARGKAAAARKPTKKAAPRRKAAARAVAKAKRRPAARKTAAAKKPARAKVIRKKAVVKKAPPRALPLERAAVARAPREKAAPAPRPAPAAPPQAPILVEWQAHRGGGGIERPDNTLVSFVYGWNLGAIAEADVRQTRDGRIICLHDATLARTTDAPAEIANIPVTELDYGQFATVDAGVKFSPVYAGERVPLLEEVLARMADSSERRMYLDIKRVDLKALADLIRRFGLESRIYVASSKIVELDDIKRQLPRAKTLLWCGGSELEIQAKFRNAATAGFYHLDQIQLHLEDELQPLDWRYQIKPAFIKEAMQACAARGVDFEVLPWKFERKEIEALLDLGVRWYATDEPARFLDAVEGWKAARAGGGGA